MQKKIKVLYFLNSYVRGGVEEHVLGLFKNMDRSSFDPIIVCPQTLIDTMKEELGSYQVPYYAVTIRNFLNVVEIYHYWKIIKDEKPDIVHSHLFFATFFIAPLSKIFGVKYIIDTAHIRERWRKGLKKIYIIDRCVYAFVSKIICVSDAIRKYVVEEKKISESKAVVVKNGVDLQKFSFSPERLASEGDLKFVVIGRLEEQKGHKFFLKAIQLLGEDASNCRFIIVGSGSLEQKLKELSEDLGISQQVKFLGYCKNIQKVFNVSGCCGFAIII